MQPGKINFRDRAKQLVDFSGLQFISPQNGTIITPTDVDGGIFIMPADGLIEYNNEGYIIFELKLEGIPMRTGQRLCFERLIDDISKPAIFFLADHNIDDPSLDIDAAATIVRQLYFNESCGFANHSRWIYRTKAKTTLGSYIDRFISKSFTMPQDKPK